MEKRRDAIHCVPTFFPPCINHIVVRGTNCCAGHKLLCGAQFVVRGTNCCAGHKLLCGAQIVVPLTGAPHPCRMSALLFAFFLPSRFDCTSYDPSPQAISRDIGIAVCQWPAPHRSPHRGISSRRYLCPDAPHARQ